MHYLGLDGAVDPSKARLPLAGEAIVSQLYLQLTRYGLGMWNRILVEKR
jgi:hypothetical protein